MVYEAPKLASPTTLIYSSSLFLANLFAVTVGVSYSPRNCLSKISLEKGCMILKEVPRLFYARNYFQQFGLDEDSNFQELGDFYLEWRNFDEYIVIQKQTESQRTKGEIEKQTIVTKCSKRGNDVYWWRVDKRLGFLENIKHSTLFDPHAAS